MENINSLDGSYIATETYNKAKRELDNSNDDIENRTSKRSKGSENSDEFICKTCKATFVNSSNLRHHVESYHVKTNSWSCAQCGKVNLNLICN